MYTKCMKLKDGYEITGRKYNTLLFLCFFKATSRAYGSSQTRDRIGATAAGLYHSSQQHWIPDTMSEARERTCIFMDISQIHFCRATTGTPNGSIILLCVIADKRQNIKLFKYMRKLI